MRKMIALALVALSVSIISISAFAYENVFDVYGLPDFQTVLEYNLGKKNEKEFVATPLVHPYYTGWYGQTINAMLNK